MQIETLHHSQSQQHPKYHVKLDKFHEFRIQYSKEHKNQLTIDLKSGEAEIFGLELSKNKTYYFPPGSNFFIYTYSGCELEMNKKDDKFIDPQDIQGDQDPRDHPMVTLANISFFLNELRQDAQDKQKLGPAILVCGGSMQGKSTVIKILINYACKQGWSPLLVDLDITKNSMLSGGVIGACKCSHGYPEDILDIEEKILFYNGYQSISYTNKSKEECLSLQYQEQLKRIGRLVQSKLENNLKKLKTSLQKDIPPHYREIFQTDEKWLFSSGCFIDLPYIPNQFRDDLLKSIIEEYFNVNAVIVVEDDNLYLNLAKQFHPRKNILFAKKLMTVDQEDRKKQNIKALGYYFKGKRSEISTTSIEISFDKVKIYKIYEITQPQEADIPIQGKEKKILRAKLFDFRQKNIVMNIIGLLHCKFTAEEEKDPDRMINKILDSPLAVLGHIVNMSTEKQTLTINLPSSEYSEDISEDMIWVIGDWSCTFTVD